MTIIEVSKQPKVELTTKKHSYVYHLNVNSDLIQDMYEDESINSYQLADKVKQIIINVNDKEIDKKSKATLRFLQSLDKVKYSKDEIVMLVWNSMMKGDGLGVI